MKREELARWRAFPLAGSVGERGGLKLQESPCDAKCLRAVGYAPDRGCEGT